MERLGFESRNALSHQRLAEAATNMLRGNRHDLNRGFSPILDFSRAWNSNAWKGYTWKALNPAIDPQKKYSAIAYSIR
jgi:hypothetical protein